MLSLLKRLTEFWSSAGDRYLRIVEIWQNDWFGVFNFQRDQSEFQCFIMTFSAPPNYSAYRRVNPFETDSMTWYCEMRPKGQGRIVIQNEIQRFSCVDRTMTMVQRYKRLLWKLKQTAEDVQCPGLKVSLSMDRSALCQFRKRSETINLTWIWTTS
jgi:hypothetical protein